MADKEMIKRCEDASKRIRRNIIDMTYGTGNAGAHLGGSLSIVELLAGLYAGVIRIKATPLKLCAVLPYEHNRTMLYYILVWAAAERTPYFCDNLILCIIFVSY